MSKLLNVWLCAGAFFQFAASGEIQRSPSDDPSNSVKRGQTRSDAVELAQTRSNSVKLGQTRSNAVKIGQTRSNSVKRCQTRQAPSNSFRSQCKIPRCRTANNAKCATYSTYGFGLRLFSSLLRVGKFSDLLATTPKTANLS